MLLFAIVTIQQCEEEYNLTYSNKQQIIQQYSFKQL